MKSNLKINIKYERFGRQIRNQKIFTNKLPLFRDHYNDLLIFRMYCNY